MSQQTQKQLDHHANQLNPTSDKYQKAQDNHANQLNPNNPRDKKPKLIKK